MRRTRRSTRLRRRGIGDHRSHGSNPTRAGFSYPPDLLAPLGSRAWRSCTTRSRWACGSRVRQCPTTSRAAVRTSRPTVSRLTASTSEAYALLFKLLCDAGDTVLVPRPSYPLFEHLTVLESVDARPYRLEYHGEWRIDVDHLRAALDDTNACGAGRVAQQPDGFVPASRRSRGRRRAVRVARHGADRRRSVRRLSARCCAACRRCWRRATWSRAALEDCRNRSACRRSSSAGSDSAVPLTVSAALLPAYEVIADTYLSVSTPVQMALPAAARSRRGNPLADPDRVFAATSHALQAAAARIPSITVLRAEGGWSAVLQGAGIPQRRSARPGAARSRITSSFTPAIFFDFAREAYLVVSLSSSRTRSIAAPRACSRGRRERCRDVKATTPQRGAGPAVLADVARSWGDRRVPRPAASSRDGCASAGQSFVQILPITEIPEPRPRRTRR